jgi:hypothetical protein
MTCLFIPTFGQEPYDPEANWQSQISEEGTSIVLDKFSAGLNRITGIRWWGLGDCASPAEEFVIRFYEDAGGVPGTLISEQTGPPSRLEATGEMFGAQEAYVFTIRTLDTALCLSSGWVSISTPAGGCEFDWLGSGDGLDANSLAGLTPPLSPVAFDMAFCLIMEGESCEQEDPLLQCPAGSLVSQPPHLPSDGGWCAAPSDPDYNAYKFENFSELSAPIEMVSWWGVDDCDTGDKEFVVAFYGDDQGSPGGRHSQYTVTPVVEPVDGLWGGMSPGDRYSAELYPACALRSGWVCVYPMNDPCTFSWLCSPHGDGVSYLGLGSFPTENLSPSAMDFAFCLSVLGENLAACPGDTLYTQAVALPGDPERGDLESDAALQIRCADNFSGVTGPIHAVSWWGVGRSSSGMPCSNPPEAYWLRFYLDDSGQPGELFQQYVVNPVVNEAYISGFPISTVTLRLDTVLDTPCALDSGWLSIQGVSESGCYFSWSASSDGDDRSYRVEGFNQTLEAMDFAFCLLTEDAEGEGSAEGEGQIEGVPEGEGIPEGEGEGISEGIAEGTEEGEGLPEGEGEGQPATEHTADQDANGVINLTELLRVIQFYNVRGFCCVTPPDSSEDGFLPGAGGDQSCAPHASDYAPQDWQINLTELLRLIQFFNIRAYHPCPGQGTEDGFCPGPE